MPAELSLGAVETNLLTIAIDKLVNTPAMKVTTSQKNATIPKAFKASYRKYIFNLPKELSFRRYPMVYPVICLGIKINWLCCKSNG